MRVSLAGVGDRPLKVLLFLVCALPFARLALEALGVGGMTLGANPIETLLHRCGKWGLNFLMITLCVTPLRHVTGWTRVIRFRRMLGLFTFFYVTLHFTVYIVLDQSLGLGFVLEDIAERPYITVGFAGFVLLIPLAVTSTKGMVRHLGRRWKQLHRLVYLTAILGVWHYFWQVKQDIREPLIYASVLAVLLGFRLVVTARRRRHAKPAPAHGG